MRPRFNTPESIQPGHIRACSLPGRSENRLKNVAGAGGNHEVAGLGHEVRGGTREGFGGDLRLACGDTRRSSSPCQISIGTWIWCSGTSQHRASSV